MKRCTQKSIKRLQLLVADDDDVTKAHTDGFTQRTRNWNKLPMSTRLQTPVQPNNLRQDLQCTCLEINFSLRKDGLTMSSVIGNYRCI